MAFDLSEYIEVNVRVGKFWSDYPEGAIRTEILSFENGIVVIKASVYKNANNEKPDATGHAYEKENTSYINKTSAVENCETSAVGRALGIMGYEIKKSIASKEEMQNALEQQEKIKNEEETSKPIKPIKPKPEQAKPEKEVDPDIELKKQLMKKHNGNAELAKKEYLEILKERHKDIIEVKEEVAV